MKLLCFPNVFRPVPADGFLAPDTGFLLAFRAESSAIVPILPQTVLINNFQHFLKG